MCFLHSFAFPDHERRLWRFLERLADLPNTRHYVAVMHYWPFMKQPDDPAWDPTRPVEYDNWYFSMSQPHRGRIWQLLQDAGVELLLCDHVHTGPPEQLIDGIRVYHTAPAGNTPLLGGYGDLRRLPALRSG